MNTKTAGRKVASKTTTARRPDKALNRRKAVIKTTAVPPAAPVRKSVGRRIAKTPAIIDAVVAPPSVEPARVSKQAQLISSLSSKPGATIEQMMSLTGWQAHTVRGAISAVLRKKLGLNVTSVASGEAGGRIYRIVDSAAAA